MKKASQLNLNEDIFILRKDFVNESISERPWYEVVDIRIRRLELNEKENEILINKSLPDECSIAGHEDIYLKKQDADILCSNLNERELDAEKKFAAALRKDLDNSEKIIKFFSDLKAINAKNK